MLKDDDYKEPGCAFDFDFYKDKKERPEIKGRIKVSEMLSQVDRLYAREDFERVEKALDEYINEARALGDCEGELSAVNELVGCLRMSGKAEKGEKTVERCFELLALTGQDDTTSGGTVLLNAATALCAFGKPKKALETYKEACRIYSRHLPPEDERFAGLYNNMASAYESTGGYADAEKYYKAAIKVLDSYNTQNCLLDKAVTYLNLAMLYNAQGSCDGRMEESAKEAMKILDSDMEREFYYAHTARKCAGGFSYLGYFLFASELNERADKYYNERS